MTTATSVSSTTTLTSRASGTPGARGKDASPSVPTCSMLNKTPETSYLFVQLFIDQRIEILHVCCLTAYRDLTVNSNVTITCFGITNTITSVCYIYIKLYFALVNWHLLISQTNQVWLVHILDTVKIQKKCWVPITTPK